MGVDTFKTYNDGNVPLATGPPSTFTTDGPLGAVPPGPTGSPTPLWRSSKLDRDGHDAPGRRSRGRRRAPRSGTRRPSRPGSTPTRRPRADASSLDLAFEAVFASEPRDVSLLFTSSCTSAAPATRERRHARAGSSTPRAAPRSRASSAARSASPCGWPSASAGVSSSLARAAHHADPRRASRSSRTAGRSPARPVIVTAPAALARVHRLRADAPGQRAQLLQRIPDGQRRSSASPSTTSPSGATGPRRLHERRHRPGRADLRQLAARRLARRSCSASSRGTAGRVWSRPPDGRAPRRRARNFATFYGERAPQADAVLRRWPGPNDAGPAAATGLHAARRAARLRGGPPAPVGASTGPAPRPRRSGTATWTARCARASARLPRSSPTCEKRRASLATLPRPPGD